MSLENLSTNMIQMVVGSSVGAIILGAVLLALGIIMNYIVPNRWWFALVAVGVVILIIGVILYLFSL